MEIHPTHKGMGWRMRWSARKKRFEKEWLPTIAAKQYSYCKLNCKKGKLFMFDFMTREDGG